MRTLILLAYSSRRRRASRMNASWRGRRGAIVWFASIFIYVLAGENGGMRGDCTSSGYKSSLESRGMCSVKANDWKPLEMAVWRIVSRSSFAWPGQNWPEWLCIEKAIWIDTGEDVGSV